MLASVDWTNVLDSLIAGLPAIIVALGAALFARRGAHQAVRNGQALETPSGDPIGHVVERAHDLAAVSTLALATTEATPATGASVRRLNMDDRSPVHVNGEEVTS